MERWPPLLAKLPAVEENPNPILDGSKGRSFAAILSDERLPPESLMSFQRTYNLLEAALKNKEEVRLGKTKNLKCFYAIGDEAGTVLWMTMDPPITTKDAKDTLRILLKHFPDAVLSKILDTTHRFNQRDHERVLNLKLYNQLMTFEDSSENSDDEEMPRTKESLSEFLHKEKAIIPPVQQLMPVERYTLRTDAIREKILKLPMRELELQAARANTPEEVRRTKSMLNDVLLDEDKLLDMLEYAKEELEFEQSKIETTYAVIYYGCGGAPLYKIRKMDESEREGLLVDRTERLGSDAQGIPVTVTRQAVDLATNEETAGVIECPFDGKVKKNRFVDRVEKVAKELNKRQRLDDVARTREEILKELEKCAEGIVCFQCGKACSPSMFYVFDQNVWIDVNAPEEVLPAKELRVYFCGPRCEDKYFDTLICRSCNIIKWSRDQESECTWTNIPRCVRCSGIMIPRRVPSD